MFPQLETKRLLLREVRPEDQRFVFEGMSHPDVVRYYGNRYAMFEATAAQMAWYKSMVAEGWGVPRLMADRQTAEKIGVIAVYYYKPEHNKAEVGFWLLPQYWNKGLALEALQAVLKYWKKEKGLHRMEAFVETENAASAKVLEKAGFVHEGTMRDCQRKNGRYISLKVYGLVLP